MAEQAKTDRIAELERALQPFSDACVSYVANWRSDQFPIPVYIKAGDLRRARATLTKGDTDHDDR